MQHFWGGLTAEVGVSPFRLGVGLKGPTCIGTHRHDVLILPTRIGLQKTLVKAAAEVHMPGDVDRAVLLMNAVGVSVAIFDPLDPTVVRVCREGAFHIATAPSVGVARSVDEISVEVERGDRAARSTVAKELVSLPLDYLPGNGVECAHAVGILAVQGKELSPGDDSSCRIGQAHDLSISTGSPVQ